MKVIPKPKLVKSNNNQYSIDLWLIFVVVEGKKENFIGIWIGFFNLTLCWRIRFFDLKKGPKVLLSGFSS